MQEVTSHLNQAAKGDVDAIKQVWMGLHSDIHNIASRLMAGESPSPTLQPTVLINEAYIKLFGNKIPECENRQHFLAMISRSMTNFLIDRARKKGSLKRGGDRNQVPLTIAAGELVRYDTIASDSGIAVLEALQEIQIENPLAADVAHLRLILGLTNEQTAVAMEISPSTAKGKWDFARATLKMKLSQVGKHE